MCIPCTSCSRRKDYNPAPYGEPGLLWPWNITNKPRNHDGVFSDSDDTMKDQLLPGTGAAGVYSEHPLYTAPLENGHALANGGDDGTIEMMQYRDGTTVVMYNNPLIENGNAVHDPNSPGVSGPRTQQSKAHRFKISSNPQQQPEQQQGRKLNDFEPVVLFNPLDKEEDISSNPHRYRPNNIERQMSYERSSANTNAAPQNNSLPGHRQWTPPDERRSDSERYDSTPSSIIEKYFQSQEPYAIQQQQQKHNKQKQQYKQKVDNIIKSPPSEDMLDYPRHNSAVDNTLSNNRDSILTEESVDLHDLDSRFDPPSPLPLLASSLEHSSKTKRRSPPKYTELYNDKGDPPFPGEGGIESDTPEATKKPSPPNYRDIISSLSDYSDAPRALFRGGGGNNNNGVVGVGNGDSSARRNKRNRKSLDSLLLKTLEDIEEQEILNAAAGRGAENGRPSATDTNSVNTPALEKHVALVRDALQKATRSFDSVSSTCSSSVGELRRAFEFGKKYGLQNYGEIPDYLQESMDDLTIAENDEDECVDENAFRDFLEQEKLLDLMALTNFSEQPKSLNDIEVQMPLPVRLNDSSSEDEEDGDIDDADEDDGGSDIYYSADMRNDAGGYKKPSRNQQTLSLV